MRIGYFADGPWSHKAIEKIVNRDDVEIVFIVPRFDTQDPVLKSWAERLNVPFLISNNVNASQFINDIKKFNADLLVSMSFNQILKSEIIELADKGFINCHAGALPFYRGRNPLNWVLINGEESFGITAHYVDTGIDTGDIIEQRKYHIAEDDCYQTLLELAITECAEVLNAAITKLKHGDFKSIPQSDIHPIGTYFGMRKLGDENIDFSWTAKRIHNFVRAISSPGPGARFLLEGKEYSIEKAKLIPNAPSYIATIGEVVGKTEEGVVIKVGDSSILVTKIRDQSNLNNIFIPQFRIGTRLKMKV